MDSYKVGFIGCGNIANAIISGSIDSGYIKYDNLYVYDCYEDKTKPFLDLGANVLSSEIELVKSCDFIFLTVKPQVYDDVLNTIRLYTKDKCIIAVAAGITISHIKSILGSCTSIIRVMPNTPLMCRKGASALVKEKPVTDEQYNYVKGFFSCCGVVADVEENQINIVTAISGSSPAFIMEFIEQMINFATENGMEKDIAQKLILQSFIGSAELIKSSDKPIRTLIQNVTSPNGTTEAGIQSLNTSNFSCIINNCLKSTVNRANELTK